MLTLSKLVKVISEHMSIGGGVRKTASDRDGEDSG